MPDPQLRAADSDREAVAATLGRAFSEGRLTVEEYDERLAKAYTARTYGELAGLTTDLPGTRAVARPAAEPQRLDRSPRGGSMRLVWAPWLTTALVVVAIWLATSVASGRFQYFWPVWVIGPWGAVLLARTITGDHPHGRSRRHR